MHSLETIKKLNKKACQDIKERTYLIVDGDHKIYYQTKEYKELVKWFKFYKDSHPEHILKIATIKELI